MRRPIHLILDWDGTLTRKDTLALVGSIAYHATCSNHLPPWSDFVNGYMNDYTAHQSTYEPTTNERTSLDQERKWLASLTPIENKSVRRVEASALFKGVKSCHVDHIAASSVQDGDLQLRPHWQSLFQIVLSPSSKDDASQVSILSVNWSQRFIRSSLLAAAGNDPGLKSHVEKMTIRANEIADLDAADGSNGNLSKDASSGIRTSADKLANLPLRCQQRLDLSAPSATSTHEAGNIVVYIGDSATDLEALLAADVGICIRDEPMGSSQRELSDTLSRIGVQVKDITDGVVFPPDIGGQRTVYWVSDFDHVAKAVRTLGVSSQV